MASVRRLRAKQHRKATSAACTACLAARLMCDLKRPQCSQCSFAGRTCPGAVAQVRWVAAATPDQRSPLAPNLRPLRGRPRLKVHECHSDSSLFHLTATDTGSLRVLEINGLVEGKETQRRGRNVGEMALHIPPAIPESQEDSLCREKIFSLVCFNEHISPAFVALEQHLNPHLVPLRCLDALSLASSIVHMLLSVVSTFRTIRSKTARDLRTFGLNAQVREGWRNGSTLTLDSIFSPERTREIWKHRQNALCTFVQLIGSDPQVSRLVFEMMPTYLLAEVQQSAFGPWRTHLDAMQDLYSVFGGWRCLDKSAPKVRYSISIYLVARTLSFITTKSSALKHLANSEDFFAYIDEGYHNPLVVGFPCSNDVLTVLMRINDLRKRNTQNYDVVEHCRKMLIDLSSAASIGPYQGARNGVADDWTYLDTAFRASVALYGMRILLIDKGCLSVDDGRICKQANSIIHQCLEYFILERSTMDSTWLGRFLFLPLFIFGIEIRSYYVSSYCSMKDHEVNSRKELVRQGLGLICFVMGMISPLQCLMFLENLWAREESCKDESWDSLVSPIKDALFFI